MSVTSVLRRATGTGTAVSLMLALLVGGCLLAAVGGPRLGQAAGTRALRQVTDDAGPAATAIAVSGTWQTISNVVGLAGGLTPADLTDVTGQFRQDFGGGVMRLAPQSADWAAITSDTRAVVTALPALRGVPAQLEVTYRYPVAGHLRLVSGSMDDAGQQAGSTHSGPSQTVTDLPVVVTAQTARLFGLRAGSRVLISLGHVNGPKESLVRLDVTGVVEPADPGSAFWTADPLLPAPSLDRVNSGKQWEGAFIADPGQGALFQQLFGQPGTFVTWELPIDTARLHAQPQAMFDDVDQITNQVPDMNGLLASISTVVTVQCGLLAPLAALTQAESAVSVLDELVTVSLAVAGLVVLLLAARMIALRRSAEMAVLRARGASLRQLFTLGSLGAAVACVPAAALAWGAAVLLVPGSAPAGAAAWWPGLAAVAIAVAGTGAAAAWPHRPPPRARNRGRLRGRRRRFRAPRLVLEITAVAAAAGGITVLRGQGATDLYASATPVLVAVPAVIVVLRLCPPLLRGLARALARGRGVIGFLGFARAARATATLALPAMTLVLALTMAAFTGMIRDAVLRGETAASWQQTGADVVISAPSGASTAAARAIAAVPGVQHAAAAVEVTLTISGRPVTAIAVDPASYAALAASAPGFSPVHSALLTRATGAPGVIPVLASPQAAAALRAQAGRTAAGAGSVVSTLTAQDGLPALRVRVAGELPSTPALPAGGAFFVLPLAAIRGAAAVNLMLLTGPSIDLTRLRAVTGPAMTIETRSQVLRELTGAPVQQGTFLLFNLAIAAAAALALCVMLLELALGAADREVTLARLATMGLPGGQRLRLMILEVLPAIAASALAAAACAVALPGLVAPAIDLSVFTQSRAPVPLRPDSASFVLPFTGLVVVSVIALAYQIRSGRRDRVAMSMRA